ncbi:MAG: ferredoxin [Verrucomicrobia subdivision 3 bacterium]|nr:ferredoxin [Limisphaerales bacterium]
MSLETFKKRMADNVPDKVYVGDQCLDCDLCREVAPENFARNDQGGYSYVKKQPETPEEWARCREAIEGCCTETFSMTATNLTGPTFPPPLLTISRPKDRPSERRLQQNEEQHNCCRKDRKDGND